MSSFSNCMYMTNIYNIYYKYNIINLKVNFKIQQGTQQLWWQMKRVKAEVVSTFKSQSLQMLTPYYKGLKNNLTKQLWWTIQ